MARAIYDLFISNSDSGKTVPGALVRVNQIGGGAALVDLYDSLAGGATVANPAVADPNGRVTFYAESGKYTVTVSYSGATLVYNDVIISDVESSEIDASKVISGTFSTSRIPNLSASKITSGTFSETRIPSLDASKISSGTFPSGRIPSLSTAQITSGTFSTSRIPNLSADKINSGVLSAGRIPNIDASKISTGLIDPARLPSGSDSETVLMARSSQSVTSSAIPSNNTDSELTIASLASGAYIFEALIIWQQSGGSSQGIKWGFGAGGGSVDINFQSSFPDSASIFAVNMDGSAASQPGYDLGATTSIGMISIKGYLNTPNSTNFDFRFSQNSSNANATIRLPGSWMKVRRTGDVIT